MSSESRRHAPSLAREVQAGWLLGVVHALALGAFGLWREAPVSAILLGLSRYAAWGLLATACFVLLWGALRTTTRRFAGGRPPLELSVSRALVGGLLGLWSLMALRIAIRQPGMALVIAAVTAIVAALLVVTALRPRANRREPAPSTRADLAAATAALAVAIVILSLPSAPPPRAAARSQEDLARPLETLRPQAISRLREGGAPTNLLLITIDTLRADRLGCYGYERATSPVIDALAARGVLFEQAICQRPKTSPSVATLLTGSYPIRHGIHTPKQRLSDANLTLAEILRDEGYRCAASVTNGNLYPVFAFDQGFESYAYGHKDAASGVARAIEWFEDELQPGERFFFWLHLTDPHWPYEPDPPFDQAFGDGRPEDLYDGEIAYTDAQLGALFDWFDARPALRERTLVVFTADHGESMGEHGELYEHGLHGYEEAARVPLIFAAEGSLPTGVRRAAPVGLVDLLPTLLDFLGLPVPEGVQGASALPLVTGLSEFGPRNHVYCEAGYGEHIGPGRTRILRRGSSKSIFRLRDWAWYPERPLTLLYAIDAALEGALAPDEYYDLATDPGEQKDLRASRGEQLARDRALVSALVGELAREARAAAAIDPSSLDAETYESLKSLGYID